MVDLRGEREQGRPCSVLGKTRAICNKICIYEKKVVSLHHKSKPLDVSQDRHSVSYGAAHGGMCAAGRR